MKITRIEDYYEKMQELYPTVPKRDLLKIMRYGWEQIYRLNANGADVDIVGSNYKCYFGQFTYNSVVHFNYYKKKLCIKLRILYHKRKVPYNGYYYFALSDERFEQYLQQKRRRGRPRKHFKYGEVMLYKLYDECCLRYSSCKYIFRIKVPIELGFKRYMPDLNTDQAELYEVRDVMTFKDILVQNRKYELIHGTKGNS